MWSAHHDPSPESSGLQESGLCGVNHVQGNGFEELHGAILDAGIFRQGYKANDIRILTDYMEKKPTKSNIIEAMSWLVQSAKPSDSLFLIVRFNSGHGDWVLDQNGDEMDGKDEGLAFRFLPDIRKTLVDPLPAGCRLTSCHSGTILGERSCCRFLRYDSHGRPQRECAISVTDPLANVMCWSGATDDQNSNDGSKGGVMTQAFIKSVEEKPKQSYKELLHSIRKFVKHEVDKQTPQLTTSHQIVSNAEVFIFCIGLF
ncbi:peptidase C14, caspase domain-containing protein [Armillaria mellea]|nr:peptidase C14, caspase domain-containing protein [Armillaria mellea]